MAQLHVSIDKLQEVSNNFADLSKKINNDNAEMKRLLEQLPSLWNGTEFDEALDYLKQAYEFNKVIIKLLSDMGASLGTVAECYAAAEEQAVNAILSSDVIE